MFSKDDLVVGAPFYLEPHVGGAIYVYMNGPEVIYTPLLICLTLILELNTFSGYHSYIAVMLRLI